MAEKMKKTKKARKPKRSKGEHGGGGKVHMTELQKVLIVNGGVGHSRLRKGKFLPTAPKRLPADV